MIHRINVFFLSLVIALSPIIFINNANAAGLNGWTLSNPVAKGASTLYDATKNVMLNGKNVVKTSTALITPTASQVAKVLARGGAGYALSIAVEQLLGAVDWVLDPANNEIKYKEIVCSDGSKDCASELLYQAKWDTTQTDWHYSRQSACTATAARMASVAGNPWKWSGKYYTYGECIIDNKKDPANIVTVHVSVVTKPNVKPVEEEKKLPLDVVAQKVISNAESGDTTAQSATTAAAADVVAEAEKDSAKARPIVNQIESNSSTATNETATGESTTKDPTTGAPTKTDISLNFPVFCNWAPVVCEAANVVINFPITLDEWWETSNRKADGWANSISSAWAFVKDWVKTEEPVDRQTKVDIEPSVEPEINNSYLQWNAYCPFTAKSDDISINGETSALSSDLTSWCTMASEIKPFVLLAGALASLMIVSGVGLGRGED